MGERPWNSWNSRQAVLSRPRVSPKSFRFFSGTTISPALSIIEMSCMKKKNRPVAARSRAPALEIAQAAMPTAPQASRVPSTVQAWFSGPPQASRVPSTVQAWFSGPPRSSVMSRARAGVVLGAAAVELDVDVLVGHGPHSFVSSSFAGPEMILMASFGTGATLCCASPAVEEADKLLRHVRGVRRDENLVIGIQNQRHGL